MTFLALGLIAFVLGVIFAIKVLYVIGVVLLVIALVLYVVSSLPARRR